MIDPKTIGVALSTFYSKWYQGALRSSKHTEKVRGDLALTLLKKAASQGYHVVVTDAKSNRSFRRALEAIPGINIIKRNLHMKRSPARRLAFKALSQVSEVKAIVYTDPEKLSFVESGIERTVEPILKGEADIVIPKREDSLFKSSYPDYQYESEIEGNKLYNELLRSNKLISKDSEDLDLFFGPKVFKNEPKIVNCFLKKFNLVLNKEYSKDFSYDPEDYSNVIFFPVVWALKHKFKVKSVEIDFTYPKLQKENEESGLKELFIEKRRVQKLAILIELMYFLNKISKTGKRV